MFKTTSTIEWMLTTVCNVTKALLDRLVRFVQISTFKPSSVSSYYYFYQLTPLGSRSHVNKTSFSSHEQNVIREENSKKTSFERKNPRKEANRLRSWFSV